MADNTTLNAGSGGDVIRTDDDGTAKWQYVKLAWGADNTQTIVDASNPIPVEITDGTAAIAKAEDSAHGSGDSGIMALAVRNDTLAALAGTDGDYTPLQVDAAGALYTVSENDVVDSNNSTTSTLTANTDYTGTGTDVLGYSGITVVIFADQDSDVNGMRFEFSTDNSNWDISQTFDYKASTGRQFQFGCQARYFRVAFQNGGTNQTAFRLQTILHRNPVSLTTVHRADADIAIDRSATLVKSILMAQAAGSGNFTPVDATTGGNLKVSLSEASDGLDIGAGNAGTETIRVSVATDDVNLASINTDAGTIAAGYAAEGAALGSGVLLQGDDGTDRKNINVDATTGDVQVDVTNTVTVDGSGVTQPVSASSLPLPTGAATAANQSTGNTSLSNIQTAVQIIDNSILAHDSAVGSTQVNMAGARATNSIEGITQVANGDGTRVAADLNGVQITRPHTTLEEIITERVSNTNGTSTAFSNFGAGGAGIHNYITTISIYNDSATDGYVDFRDGTAGSVIFTAPAPTKGGSVINFPVPLKGAANTALAYDVSGALSTVYISVVGFQAQG